jgi:hypothetical protein
MSKSFPESELRRLIEEAVHDQWLPKVIEYGEKTCSLLEKKKCWILARVQPGRLLITSDCPAVAADIVDEPRIEITPIGGLVHFPLSSDRTVLISDNDLRINPGGLTNRQIRFLNDYEMHYAWRWVFSERNEDFVDTRFKMTKAGALLGITRETGKIYEIQQRYSRYLESLGREN